MEQMCDIFCDKRNLRALAPEQRFIDVPLIDVIGLRAKHVFVSLPAWLVQFYTIRTMK